MRRNKKKIIIISLIGILLLMTAGYAAFQTNLDIKGTSKISSNWNVLITNVTESNKEGEAETVGTPSWTDLTAYMEANLYQKGDFVEYDVTVENRGTLDAKLDSITDNIKSTNEAVKITFGGYTKGEKLEKGQSQTIKVKVEYNPDFTGTPEEGSGEVSVDLNYTQNDDYSEGEDGNIISPERYLVTYDCTTNGGNNCSSYNEYLKEGETVNLLNKGTHKEYKFIGWNTNKGAEEGLTELQMGSENITLYAIYEGKPIIKSWCDETLSEDVFPRVINTEFHSDEYREKIVSATFLDDKNVPENAVVSWDVSEAKDKSVMAWLIPNNSDNTKYDLYIGGNGGVIANKNSSYLFFKFYNLKTIDFGTNYDTSNVTSMYCMFDNYSNKGALSEIKGLEYFDTSKVTNMAGMFRNGSYTTLDVSNFDVSKVTSTNSMFDKNTYLKTINLSNWETDSLENMAYMFNSCNSLESIDIRYFNTKNVTTMKALFQHCPKLKEINLGTWNTSNVENMDSMFYNNEGGDSQLRKINLCSFDTSKVTNMNHMFRGTKNLEKVYVGSKWTTANASVISTWLDSKISSVTQSNNCMIDAENPAIIKLSSSSTTNSITVVADASSESGISKYEYSINGVDWVEDDNFHKFLGLIKNTEYSIKVRVTSKVGKVTTSNELKVTTNELSVPTFVENEAETDKKVTIIYPEGCGDTLTCSYQKDEDEWIEVTEKSKDVMYSDSGSLVAKVFDGTNESSSSYAVIFEGIEIEYTGGVQEYIAEKDGYYKIELWGASGGKIYSDTNSKGGAYTKGEIYLTKGDKLYVYVGQQGNASDVCSSIAGFNNGAINDKNANGVCGPTGGGATDVRLVSGNWDNVTSLRSRIMVAAGGTFGSEGGDLIGREAVLTYEYYDYVGKQAKQTRGGVVPTKFSSATSNGTAGGFGFAGNGGASVYSATAYGGASGSSGYYGGSGASGLNSGVFYAGSGSSYISGYAGSNSITSASSDTHTNQTKHYSGRYFINTEMKAGVNNGNGKSKITYIKYPSSKDSEKIKGVRYIKDCINGNNSNSMNHWVEIQAINQGENVAKGKNVTGLKNGAPAGAYNNTTHAFSHAVDGIMDNHTGSSSFAYMGDPGNQCLIVDLGKEYNLEEIVIWHFYELNNVGNKIERFYYDNITYVAGANGNYNRSVSLGNVPETSIGKRLKEFK